MSNPASPSTPAQVLVLDDEPLIRELLSEALADCGWETVALGSADEGYRYLQHHADQIALLVTDVRMPGQMDGWELCGKVRARWPRLPIMVMSGYSQQPTQALVERSLFLSKPWSLPEVMDAAQRLVADSASESNAPAR